MTVIEIIDREPCSTCWTNECRFWEQCGGKNCVKEEHKPQRKIPPNVLKEHIQKLEERLGRKIEIEK